MYPTGPLFTSNHIIVTAVMIGCVFISHLAIGGGLYLVLAEILARRTNDPAQMVHVQRQSRFFLLMTILFGAAIGTEIWMTTRVVQQAGISWLTRDISLVWSTGSVFFAVEFAAILLYVYGWARLSPKQHLIIGWINSAAAWLSLAVINGILGLMLAPATWPETGNFWAGFFNPTFWPSLMLRTLICLILAGIFATVTAAREKDIAAKVRLLRHDGLLILTLIALAIPAGYWYLKALPANVAAELMPTTAPFLGLQMMMLAAAVLAFLTVFGTILFPRHWGYITSGILTLCGLMAIGGFEWMRETFRRPRILPNGTANTPTPAALPPVLPFAAALLIGLFLAWMLRIFMAKSNTGRQQS